MTRDPRYDILFEPVQDRSGHRQEPLLPGAALQRHGLSRSRTSNAVMREVKAEGGWGVISTEQTEIHPTGDIAPFIELRLWDDHDVPMLARIADAIHAHGALAALELCHNGMNSANLYSREVPLGPAHLPVVTAYNDPVQARAMDKEDIRNLGAGIAMPPCGRSRRATTSPMSMRASSSAVRCISSRGATTTAAMNMAAASKTARACCAN